MRNPQDVIVDSAGNLFVADTNNNCVRRRDVNSQAITIVAGIANPVTGGFEGDGGPATNAKLASPTGLALDMAGNLLIADSFNDRIRQISGGNINTIAGIDRYGFSADGTPVLAAKYSGMFDVAMNSEGDLFITEYFNHRIRRINLRTGTLSTVAGNGLAGFSGDGGPAVNASLNSPSGIAFDRAGNLFISDQLNRRVRRVDMNSGVITTVAGNGASSAGGDGGPAINAGIAPNDIAFDQAGNFLIVDFGSIRKVDAATGVITTIAGGGNSFSDNIPATQAAFGNPLDVAVDGAGNLFIADEGEEKVRKVDAGSGLITTVAGGGSGFINEGIPATQAGFIDLSAIVIDSSGNLFIADSGRLRRVDAQTGIISRVVLGSTGFSGDGGPAL